MIELFIGFAAGFAVACYASVFFYGLGRRDEARYLLRERRDANKEPS